MTKKIEYRRYVFTVEVAVIEESEAFAREALRTADLSEPAARATLVRVEEYPPR